MKKPATITKIDKKCFNKGDGINDEELNRLVEHYTQLVDLLTPLSHYFGASCEVAVRRLNRLREFQWARNMNVFEKHLK